MEAVSGFFFFNCLFCFLFTIGTKRTITSTMQVEQLGKQM